MKKKEQRHQVYSPSKSQKPQTYLLLEKLLEQQGIEYYEKNIISQLLEFSNYYTSEVINEAKRVKDVSKKSQIDINDLRMAIQIKQENTFKRPFSLSFMQQEAKV